MNLEQIKQDHENGVSISRETYRKLVEAVRVMKAALDQIDTEVGDPVRVAALARDYVEAL